MKFRVTYWYDVVAQEPMYGVQANTAKGVWSNCAQKGVALIFDRMDEAEAKAEELRSKYI